MALEYLIKKIGNREICVRGIGKMFYQDGFPLSISASELKKKGIEISYLHIIDEFWGNGWSWKTIESKLLGELNDDIDKSLNIDIDSLKYFYSLLEQPKRSNGGYEESRDLIFQYLFGLPSSEVIKGYKSIIN